MRQDLTTLLNQVVIRDAKGKLRIDYEAAKGSVTPPCSPGVEGVQEYASCVVEGVNPFIGFVDFDWKLFRTWVAQRNRGALARYLGKEVSKHAAKIGIK